MGRSTTDDYGTVTIEFYRKVRGSTMGQKERILDLLAQRPEGLTSSEVELLSRHAIPAGSANSRMCALAKTGQLTKAPRKRVGPQGQPGTVFRLAHPENAPPTLPGFEPT